MVDRKYISFDEASERLESELGNGIRLSDKKLQAYAESVDIRCPTVSGKRMINLTDFITEFDVLFRKIADKENLGRENQRIGTLRYNTLILATQDALSKIDDSKSVKELFGKIVTQANSNISEKILIRERGETANKNIKKWSEEEVRAAYKAAVARQEERGRRSTASGASRYIESKQPTP